MISDGRLDITHAPPPAALRDYVDYVDHARPIYKPAARFSLTLTTEGKW
jgi:hypothetical protein